MSAPQPELTASQRRRVERARELTGMEVAQVAALSTDRVPADTGAWAFGYARGTIRDLLEIIDDLTGGES